VVRPSLEDAHAAPRRADPRALRHARPDNASLTGPRHGGGLRAVAPRLAEAGYRVLAVDYRGLLDRVRETQR